MPAFHECRVLIAKTIPTAIFKARKLTSGKLV